MCTSKEIVKTKDYEFIKSEASYTIYGSPQSHGVQTVKEFSKYPTEEEINDFVKKSGGYINQVRVTETTFYKVKKETD
jgi:hypothetical protein